MKMLRSVTVGAVATAMLATSVTPALAQGYGGYGYNRPGYGQNFNDGRYRQYRQRGHDNTGAIVAGVIGVGILAAILASSSKSNSQNRNAVYGSIRSDSEAADACANAAEQQFGNNARTRSIDNVDQVSGGFNVRGSLGSAYASSDDSDGRDFSCTVRQGNVQRIDFGGYATRY